MVNVSKKYIDAELRKRAWKRFAIKIYASQYPDAITAHLRAFLTRTEIIMLEKRLAIPLLLEQKLTYRTIARELGVSKETVCFVKRGLAQRPKKPKP